MRINKIIDLLQENQPVYYTRSALTYNAGFELAQSWADYVNVEMEHAPYDIVGLQSFISGLVAGGPTPSGHRTPAVVVEAPVDGTSEEVVRANAWQLRQILATGVHGVVLCHATTPGAVRAFVESCRYPGPKSGTQHGLAAGRRGAGGEARAAGVWGVSPDEYIRKADPWPLSESGELVLGVKLENPTAVENADAILSVPGIAFAECGPGDMALCLGLSPWKQEPFPPALQAARDQVLASCRSRGIAFLERIPADGVSRKLAEGVRISSGGEDGSRAFAGRQHARHGSSNSLG